MSVGFVAVQWNRKKVIYDAVLISTVALFVGGYVAIHSHLNPPQNLAAAIDIWIRATGCAACAA